jgi:hypothetical protein
VQEAQEEAPRGGGQEEEVQENEEALMRNEWIPSVFGGAVLAAALLLAPTASAATLAGDYQLQGTRASSGPGPALTDVGGANAFQSENVMGTSRQVLAFRMDRGVSMSPSVGSGDVPYSVVTTFRFQDVSSALPTSYRRILDPTNGTQDPGFYVYAKLADFFGAANEFMSPSPLFADNTYATVAMTSSPPTQSKIYVNGALAVTANETLPVVADTLRLFKDDNSVEESAGAVSCVRVYTGVLTEAEVTAIGSSPTCQAPSPAPTPTQPKTKCKKHKKKHRAADAKKKCKKKKKR